MTSCVKKRPPMRALLQVRSAFGDARLPPLPSALAAGTHPTGATAHARISGEPPMQYRPTPSFDTQSAGVAGQTDGGGLPMQAVSAAPGGGSPFESAVAAAMSAFGGESEKPQLPDVQPPDQTPGKARGSVAFFTHGGSSGAHGAHLARMGAHLVCLGTYLVRMGLHPAFPISGEGAHCHAMLHATCVCLFPTSRLCPPAASHYPRNLPHMLCLLVSLHCSCR